MLMMYVLDVWYYMCFFEEYLDVVDEICVILCDCVLFKLVNNRKCNMIKIVVLKI